MGEIVLDNVYKRKMGNSDRQLLTYVSTLRLSCEMGNSPSHRANSPSSGLGLYLSYSLNKHLITFFKQKSIFIPKNSPPKGLTIIIHDPIPFSSNFIVFPPLTALQILYSAPGEVWNWKHPKQKDFSMTQSINARDGIVIPTSTNDITRSEEYTCVVSTKDGYAKMTHFYGNNVVDCHPIPKSMVAMDRGGGNHRRMYRGESSNDRRSEEFLNHCYICNMESKMQMSDTPMHKDEGLCNKERDNYDLGVKIDVKEA